MLIFDTENNVITDPDCNLGRLELKQRPITQRYIIDTPARTHKKVIRVYPNGGKDVETVIDVSEKAHWETRLPETGELVEFDGVYPEDKKTGDIVQNVQTYYLYTPYTEEELATMEKESQERAIQKEISTLKSNLQETDYVATKIAEGVSSKEDYADILARRAEWRQEINDLESQLDSLK